MSIPLQPQKVKTGIMLLLGAYAVGFINNLVTFTMYQSLLGEALSRTIITTIVSLVIGLFLIYNINKGKNWARITMTVFLGLTLLVLLLGIGLLFKSSVLLACLSLLGVCLQLIGIIMLYSSEANAWFKNMGIPNSNNQ